MNISRISCVIGWAIVASTVHAGIISDDFESYEVGSFPGGQWHDIFGRSVGSSAEAPTMSIIETTDAHGNATRAAQTHREGGTNGLYADIDDSSIHNLSMDVRIDAMPTANTGWPVGVGYSRYSGEGDVNANPHAVIYAWAGRVWNLFIKPGEGRDPVDLRITGSNFTVGTWYNVSLNVNSETGEFQAEIHNAETGNLVNSLTHTYVGWDSSVDRFNSITVFDGGNESSPSQSQSTIDNIDYTPTPSSATLLLGGLALGSRRRR
jgi:hypothetical protein